MKTKSPFWIGLLLAAPASLAQTAPANPVCDVRDFGARGDGQVKDTAAIQAAIDQCPAGGIVRLGHGGTYLSGTIRLKSDLTLRIDPGATLRGSRDDADYPDLSPPTVNSQLNNCRRALVYAVGVENLTIEGEGVNPADRDAALHASGTIDGSGENNPAWNGPEKTRPMAVFVVLSHHVTLQALQVVNSGMWSVVNFENTDVLIDSVRVDSHSGSTRDGLDIVDSSRVTVQNCEINSEDDSICLKSGSMKGVHDVLVRDSEIKNSGVANAIKLGTASVGVYERIRFENIKIDSVKQAAMAVESVDGSAIDGVSFHNIEFHNAGTAFFVLLGQRKGAPEVGSINGVSFENVHGDTNLNWGSAISGTTIGAKTYSITNLRFSNVRVKNRSRGNLTAVPASPPEYAGQYPDPRMWDPMPAYGIFLRHVDGFTYQASGNEGAPGDPRPTIVRADVR